MPKATFIESAIETDIHWQKTHRKPEARIQCSPEEAYSPQQSTQIGFQ